MRWNPIRVRDLNGANALIYIKLEDDCYYGGAVHDGFKNLDYGSHMRRTLDSMLDLLASIANKTGENRHLCYVVDGSSGTPERYEDVPLLREVDASKLAIVLDCDEQKIRDHFDSLVKFVPRES